MIDMPEGAVEGAANPMMKWILIASGLLVVSITGYAIWGPEGDDTPRILEVCVEHTDEISHFHPHLFIIINENEVNIPSDVGVSSDCMSPVHTHDASGKLHVEVPLSEPMAITVGDFFTVWGKEFSATKLMDFEADEDNEIVMTVYPTMDDYEAGENGEISAEYEKHIFSSKDADGDGAADGDGTVVVIEYKQKDG